MKKTTHFIYILLLLLFLFVLLSSCKSNSVDTILEEDNIISENIVSDKLREYSLNLSAYSSGLNSFRAVGNKKDKEQSNYIKETFEKIGLTNIRQESVLLDGWNTEGINFSFLCDCDEENQRLTISQIGVYPSNFNFDTSVFKFFNLGTGVKEDYEDLNADVRGNGVLVINSSKNITECIQLAISKDAAFVVYALSDENDPIKYSVDLNIYSSAEIPVFVVSRGNYTLLKKAVDIGQVIDIELNGYSEITPNIETDFIVGEIVGKSSNITYITANRDSIGSGFMSSSVSVAEMFLIAEELVGYNKQPESTICFLVTTGQEWGKLGKTYNEGLSTYLKNKELSNIESVLILDGSKPLDDTVVFDTQVNFDAKLNEIEKYNSSYFEGKNLSFSNVINTANPFRITEAKIWDSLGVPYLLQSESINSSYLDLENSSLDVASLVISEEHSKFLIDFYVGLIKLISF